MSIEMVENQENWVELWLLKVIWQFVDGQGRMWLNFYITDGQNILSYTLLMRSPLYFFFAIDYFRKFIVALDIYMLFNYYRSK